MMVRRVRLAFLGEDKGETAMRRGKVRVQRERTQEMLLGGGKFLADNQDVGEIDMTDGFVGMSPCGLFVGGSRSGAEACRKGNVTKFGEDLKIGRRVANEVHVALECGRILPAHVQASCVGQSLVNVCLRHDALVCCDSNRGK